MKFSALLGSAAGNRVTCLAKALATQMRSCWSIARWNGPRNDLQGSSRVALANNPALGQIALREVDQLALRGPEGPNIAAGRDDDALHQPEPAVEGDAVRRRQRLAVLVEHRDRMAAVGREPGIVLGVDGRAEGAPFHPAAGKTGRYGRERLAVGGELGGVALPQRVLPLPADREVVADPEVALAVEHGLATRAIPAAVEL